MLNAFDVFPQIAVTVPHSHSQAETPVVSPLKALQSIVQRGRSGLLTVRPTEEDPVFWRIHMGGGHLHFANSSIGQRERLAYILQRINSPLLEELPSFFLKSSPSKSTYDFLNQAWQVGELSLPRLRSMIRLLSQEALVHILALPQAVLQFDRSIDLDPILLSAALPELVGPLSPQVVGWQRLKPHIVSPFQRLYLTDPDRFSQQFEAKVRLVQGAGALATPRRALENQPCLYELAFQLDADLLRLATVLFKPVQVGAIAMRPFVSFTETHRPTIACIDDSSTVQRNVKLILEASGYRVLGLTDPLRALSTLVREKPVLVLMDITMPELDGYELCRMLRQCSALRQTPIVMLTGRDGLVDKVKARLVGASDYITKPFNAKTLMGVLTRLTEK